MPVCWLVCLRWSRASGNGVGEMRISDSEASTGARSRYMRVVKSFDPWALTITAGEPSVHPVK